MKTKNNQAFSGCPLFTCSRVRAAVRASLILGSLFSVTASSAVNLFTDSFDRPNSNNLSASSDGMSGAAAPMTYVERGDALAGNESLVNIRANQLYLADGPNMGVLYLDHNFTHPVILDAGGMRIGLTIVSNNGTIADRTRWCGFGIGNSLAECQAIDFDHTGVGFRGQDYNGLQPGTSDLFISWSPGPDGSGVVNVYKNGPTAAGGEGIDVPVGGLSGHDRLEMELAIRDFDAGSTVIAKIFWNAAVIHTTTFQWDHANQNYIGISARQNDQGFTVEDFAVLTVAPETPPFLTDFSLAPKTIRNTATETVTLTWTADMVTPATTYEVTADKPVVFTHSDNTGSAVNGQTSIAVEVDGTLGDVEFTIHLREDSESVDSRSALVQAVSLPHPNAPNVLLILLDDAGWSDFGCYGSEIQTPHSDSLADGGVRFRAFYQSARCAPTRIGIMTGLYPQQGATHPGAALPPLRTDNNVTLAEVLSEAGYRTYMSGKWHLGGKAAGRDPISRGFHHVFGQGVNADGANTSDAFGYWLENNYHIVSSNNEIPRRQYGSQGLLFHYSDATGAYSVDFLDHHLSQADGKPFFLYMAFNAPHWPVCAPSELANKYTDAGDPAPDDEDVCLYEEGWDVIRQRKYERQLAMGVITSRFGFSGKGDHPVPPTEIPLWQFLSYERRLDLARRQAVYAAMIEQVDQNIGKVLQKLAAENLLENTLIFFCVDNGANYEGGLFGNTTDPSGMVWDPAHLPSMGQPQNADNSGYPRVNQGGGWANMSNTPFRLYKHYTHEGGIRTAAILHWPAATDPQVAGTWTEERGHIIDIMPTIVEATGAAYRREFQGRSVLPMEGVDLLPVLAGEALPDRDIGIEHERNRAFFRGDYKLSSKNFSLTDGSSPANALELYNLQDDPTELNNLADTKRDVLVEMAQGWNAWAIRVGLPTDRLITLPPPEPDFPSALIQDLFERSDNFDICAESGGMSGTLSPIRYIESYEGSGQTSSIQIRNGCLQMATGNGMSTLYIDHNFIDDSIVSAGGFTVILDVLEISGGDNPENRFGGFGVGLTKTQADAAGDINGTIALRGRTDGSGATAVSDFFVDLALDGRLRAWSGNTLLRQSDVMSAQGRIQVDFLMPNFHQGSPVAARISFNGAPLDSVLFTWTQANQNYIGLSARAINYVQMDNLVIMPFEGISAQDVDLTGDGQIDLADFGVLGAQWGSGYTLPCPPADLTRNCHVGLDDLSVLVQHWLTQE
jgi:arylsulfatase